MFKNIKLWFWSILVQMVLMFLFKTNRWKIIGEEHLNESLKSGKPLMICSWHGRLSFASYFLYYKKINPWTIASTHSDAEIIAKVIKRWGFKLIRGSSTRGGKEVLRKMNYVFKSDDNIIAITNDGPRGPRQVAKPGSIGLARKHNATILVISGTAERYWQFKSWDKFRLPKPFCTIYFRIAPPLEYPDIAMGPEEESKIISDYMNKNQQENDKC